MRQNQIRTRSKYPYLITLICLVYQLSCSGAPSEKRVDTVGVSTWQQRSSARLVIAVVYDQFSADTLLKYLPNLDPQGAVRTAIDEGVYYERGFYPYAATNTAPGHATLHTGVAPRDHGVTMNQVFNRATGSKREAIDDRKSAVFGRDNTFAGPAALCVDTVADALKVATQGRGKVVSISHKDRAAIFSAGKRPDLVLWYDRTISEFTTSSYYAQELPEWFVAWKKAHPTSKAYATWKPRNAERLQALLGPDQAPGEGDYKGFGVRFPHDPRQSHDPAATFQLTPHATEHMLQLALESVSQLGLGNDAVPDLLAISISGTDYVGHVFGPDSWEYLDHLIRIDIAVGDFLRKLSQRTEIAWLLTSDHGAAPLPEKTVATGEAASRTYPNDLVAAIENALDDAFGQGDWVDVYIFPFIYLSKSARAHPERDRVLEFTCRFMTERPDVAVAYPIEELQKADPFGDWTKRAAYLSTYPQSTADIFVVPARYYVTDVGMVRGYGSNHGTPWQYDQQVPVLIVAKDTGPSRIRNPVDQRRIAPTLSALLGIAPPAPAVLPSLLGIR